MVDFASDKPDGARTLGIEKMKAELKKIHREAIEDPKRHPQKLSRNRVYKFLIYIWDRRNFIGRTLLDGAYREFSNPR